MSRRDRRSAQARVQGLLLAETGRVVQEAVERALAAEATALLGRGPYERRRSARAERTTGRGSRCQPGWTTRLWRAGSYVRTRLTVPSSVRVRVPRVGCIYGGTVRAEIALLAPCERSWGEVQAWARELSELGLSRGDTREMVAQVSRRSVARSTLHGWGHPVRPPPRRAGGRRHDLDDDRSRRAPAPPPARPDRRRPRVGPARGSPLLALMPAS